MAVAGGTACWIGRRWRGFRRAMAGRRAAWLCRHGPWIAVLVTGGVIVGSMAPAWMVAGEEESLLFLLLASALYAVLLAVPFIPSVEIGLLIMVLFGPPGALGAYLATLVGLNGAYAIGCRMRWHAQRSGRANEVAARLPRLRALPSWRGRRLSARTAAVVALAVLLNTPGNTVVGGGGGIGIGYGVAGLLRWPVYCVTVAAATAVVPLLFVAGVVGVEHMVQWRPELDAPAVGQ